jgi:hypothetical protein
MHPSTLRRRACLRAAAALLFAFPAAAAETATEPLTISTRQGAFRFRVEIADEEAERQQGLMFRRTLASDHGMLFVFGETREIAMWMKDTPLSLDMVFVRADGTVASIAERTQPFSEAIVASGEPVAFVLELRAGVSRLIGLKPGDRLEHRAFGRN